MLTFQLPLKSSSERSV